MNKDQAAVVDPQQDILSDIDGFDWDRPANSSNIRTYSGLYVDPINLESEDVVFEDIRWALSHICRYGGHVKKFYSVAEHCMYVASQLMRTYGDKELALAGLLHDASEAYLGDIPRPLKRSRVFEGYRDIEHRVSLAIQEKFQLQYSLHDDRVTNIDGAIIAWEMAIFRSHPLREPLAPEIIADEYKKMFLAFRPGWGYAI